MPSLPPLYCDGVLLVYTPHLSLALLLNCRDNHEQSVVRLAAPPQHVAQPSLVPATDLPVGMIHQGRVTCGPDVVWRGQPSTRQNPSTWKNKIAAPCPRASLQAGIPAAYTSTSVTPSPLCMYSARTSAMSSSGLCGGVSSAIHGVAPFRLDGCLLEGRCSFREVNFVGYWPCAALLSRSPDKATC